jgi:hypothetical protein
MACDCVNFPTAGCGCKSTKKINPQKTSFCTNSQYDCQPNSKTFYTDCGGFNVGCKVYDLVDGKYNIVPDGFYSDGVYGYYITNGVVQSNPQETCPRFFLVDYIKDCLNKDNLSGTWYVTVVDDNTWVPDTNVLYRIPIPLDQTTDCIAAYRSYWAVRFANTTPVYNIGNANYVEALVNDMSVEYNLPGFLQDRCSTKAKTTPATLKIKAKVGTTLNRSTPGSQILISTDGGSTFTGVGSSFTNSDCISLPDLTFNKGTQVIIIAQTYSGGQSVQIAFNAQNGTTCPSNLANYCEYPLTLDNDINELAITVYYGSPAGNWQTCPLPTP